MHSPLLTWLLWPLLKWILQVSQWCQWDCHFSSDVQKSFFVFNLFSPSFSLVNWDTVWRANTTAKFQVSTELNRNVGLLRLFPGITAATVRCSAPETDHRCFFCLCHSHLMSRGCPSSFIDVTHYRIINRHD